MTREDAKAERAAMYAQWLCDDADWLATGIADLGLTQDEEFKFLQNAKAKLAKAQQAIDGAIFANRLTERTVA
jgi:hypothetical protein